MPIFRIDPLTDPRWNDFIGRHPDASVFHSPGWLRALQSTYGYKPLAFTTSAGSSLSNGVVFCEVRSWLTGARLVSLPFSDHCQPLAHGIDLEMILESIDQSRRAEQWKYVELRPLSSATVSGAAGYGGCKEFGRSAAFGFQKIDLRPPAETIYRGFHDSCVRRKIKRAEREALVYETGRSEKMLDQFRHLLLLTRRRHGLPPQPVAWFRNVVDCLNESATIHTLSKDSEPVASIIVLTFRKTLLYKYGCSDAKAHNLGCMPLLFWKVIQQAKEMGAETLDLGRSDYDDPGLIAFKERLGGVTSELTYYRTPAPTEKSPLPRAGAAWVRSTIACVPDAILSGAGRVLYRHLG